MFPELRKEKYKMTEEAAMELLEKGCYGVLSTLSPDGYCYGVPLHHAVIGEKLYIHCAPKGGHKLEAMRNHPKVSYVVVDANLMVMEGKMDTRYSSVCAFGRVSQVEDKKEKGEALLALVGKYDPASLKWAKNYVEGEMPVGIWRIDLEHVSGKSSFLEGDV